MPDPWPGVAVAMGSNLGDRLGNLGEAIASLERGGWLGDLRCSDAFETPPERPGDGGAFLNAVAVGTSVHPPRALLDGLLSIEREMGRCRTDGRSGGPRIIDLDLVLFDRRVIREPGLQVPHPRLATRAFVLVPLCQVSPDAVEPVSGRPVHSLLASLPERSLPRFGSLRK
jgi:2-amino-4-hydroxy-6-hydroxymethyldihydropteridine diphosphokinase